LFACIARNATASTKTAKVRLRTLPRFVPCVSSMPLQTCNDPWRRESIPACRCFGSRLAKSRTSWPISRRCAERPAFGSRSLHHCFRPKRELIRSRGPNPLRPHASPPLAHTRFSSSPRGRSSASSRYGDHGNSSNSSKNDSQCDHYANLPYFRCGGNRRGRPCHFPQSSSASRFTAARAGFLLLSQSGDRPER